MVDETPKLAVHSFEPLTYGNGPGARACLWLQGCTLGCPGCFNQETHQQVKASITVNDVVEWLDKASVEGLTISGGEPLQQMESVISLCSALSKKELSIIIFTGYTFLEAAELTGFRNLCKVIDLLIAGPHKSK